MFPLLLSCIGILMIFSLTPGSSSGSASYSVPIRQIRYLGLGLVSMLTVYMVPLSWYRKLKLGRLLWFAALLMTCGTLMPGIGVKAGGSYRWLNLGFIQFQPLEVLTLAMTLHLADRLDTSRQENFLRFWSPTFLIAALSALPLCFQSDMGGLILVFAICVSMHVVDSGWRYPIKSLLFLVPIFWLMIRVEPYRLSRLLAFLDPWEDPLKGGFQIIQGLVAFSNGGVLGLGVGKGLQKLNYLPAARTDYIFPVIGEEFGLIGTLSIVFLYAMWALKSYLLYRRSRDSYTTLLIWGMTVSVLFPMFINLGGVMKLMPLSGIPLPFVSAGGTALVLMWTRVGFLLRIGKELNAQDAGLRYTFPRGAGQSAETPYGRRGR
jgi:cell division protein FtsW